MTQRASPDQLLDEAALVFRQRNATYGNNYMSMGAIMAAHFPDGITLKAPRDFLRFHLFMLQCVKMSRYSHQWAVGHKDSMKDLAVYAAMLEHVDGGT